MKKKLLLIFINFILLLHLNIFKAIAVEVSKDNDWPNNSIKDTIDISGSGMPGNPLIILVVDDDAEYIRSSPIK